MSPKLVFSIAKLQKVELHSDPHVDETSIVKQFAEVVGGIHPGVALLTP